MPAPPHTDVTVGEIWGRTIAARECARDGNFSPCCRPWHIRNGSTHLPVGGRGERDERQNGDRPVPLPRAAPHQITTDVAEAPRRDAHSGQWRRDHPDDKNDLEKQQPVSDRTAWRTRLRFCELFEHRRDDRGLRRGGDRRTGIGVLGVTISSAYACRSLCYLALDHQPIVRLVSGPQCGFRTRVCRWASRRDKPLGLKRS
jgi:hypothetical protein